MRCESGLYRVLNRARAKSPSIKWRRRSAICDNEAQHRILVFTESLVSFFVAEALRSPLTVRARKRFRGRAIQITESRRKCLEASQACVEQSHATGESTALQMMVRGGNLDQTLEKLLDVGFSSKPDLLPCFVRIPELARIEVGNAAQEM